MHITNGAATTFVELDDREGQQLRTILDAIADLEPESPHGRLASQLEDLISEAAVYPGRRLNLQILPQPRRTTP